MTWHVELTPLAQDDLAAGKPWLLLSLLVVRGAGVFASRRWQVSPWTPASLVGGALVPVLGGDLGWFPVVVRAISGPLLLAGCTGALLAPPREPPLPVTVD